MNFDDFQAQAEETKTFDRRSSDWGNVERRRHYLLAGLTAQLGDLANAIKKRMRDGSDYEDSLKDEVREQIGHVLWYLAMLATSFEIRLSEVADENISFNVRRWHQIVDHPEFFQHDFDVNFPPDQRLPSKILARFRTEVVGGLNKTFITVHPEGPNGVSERFGDPIDDNSSVDDHYRFHDVFHLAYVAFLRWSPVVRHLLRCKRKEDAQVDRIEDGARARDVEEAATAFIYEYISGQHFLETSENIDTPTLVTVSRLLKHREVADCQLKEFEITFLEATRVLRELTANGGGWVLAESAGENGKPSIRFSPDGLFK